MKLISNYSFSPHFFPIYVKIIYHVISTLFVTTRFHTESIQTNHSWGTRTFAQTLDLDTFTFNSTIIVLLSIFSTYGGFYLSLAVIITFFWWEVPTTKLPTNSRNMKIFSITHTCQPLCTLPIINRNPSFQLLIPSLSSYSTHLPLLSHFTRTFTLTLHLDTFTFNSTIIILLSIFSTYWVFHS